MRIAILSDIHGNRTALEAVAADLRETAPDLILHGGDLADGANPVAVVDFIRDQGWLGVRGNTDEMLFDPASLDEFAAQSSAPPSLWAAIRDIAEATRAALGAEGLGWLGGLPRVHIEAPLALVHASPQDAWRVAEDSAYEALGQPVAVYGHTHRPFVRRLDRLTIANSGSVGLPYDGDTRAAYLLVDDAEPTIRRVEYDVEGECRELTASGLPHSDWIAHMLRAAAILLK